MDIYVYDGPELTAWGPFPDEAAADAFIMSDKYLQSNTHVVYWKSIPPDVEVCDPDYYDQDDDY